MDLNRPMEMTEERLSKLEDKLTKAIQDEEEREGRFLKKKLSEPYEGFR